MHQRNKNDHAVLCKSNPVCGVLFLSFASPLRSLLFLSHPSIAPRVAQRNRKRIDQGAFWIRGLKWKVMRMMNINCTLECGLTVSIARNKSSELLIPNVERVMKRQASALPPFATLPIPGRYWQCRAALISIQQRGAYSLRLSLSFSFCPMNISYFYHVKFV